MTNPLGEHGLLDMLKGEIIAISDADLRQTVLTFGGVVLVLYLFRKEFLLVSFDREMAITLQKSVLFWDALLLLVIGVAISMAVLSVGPLVAFGFLLIPPLIAHLLARNMAQFVVGAAGLGVVTAFVAFCIAYRWDCRWGRRMWPCSECSTRLAAAASDHTRLSWRAAMANVAMITADCAPSPGSSVPRRRWDDPVAPR